MANPTGNGKGFQVELTETETAQEEEVGYQGPMGPVIGSILGVIGWLVFILLYALFWSSGFSLFQNVIVTIVSFIITGLLIGLLWLVWYRPSGELRSKQEGQTPYSMTPLPGRS